MTIPKMIDKRANNSNEAMKTKRSNTTNNCTFKNFKVRRRNCKKSVEIQRQILISRSRSRALGCREG